MNITMCTAFHVRKTCCLFTVICSLTCCSTFTHATSDGCTIAEDQIIIQGSVVLKFCGSRGVDSQPGGGQVIALYRLSNRMHAYSILVYIILFTMIIHENVFRLRLCLLHPISKTNVRLFPSLPPVDFGRVFLRMYPVARYHGTLWFR